MMERRMWRDASFGITNKLWQISWSYVLLLCALAGIGYAALYSVGGGPQPYADRHIIRFCIGLALLVAIALIDIRFIARLSWPLYAFGLGMLVLVLRLGHVGKGAQRWLELGGMEVQPSEMMKIVLVLALAAWFRRASWERTGNPLTCCPRRSPFWFRRR
jgi:rod shape determining protein RodA